MANHQTVRSVVGVFTILVWIPIRCYCQQGTFAGVKVAPENLHFVGNKSFSSADLRAIFRSAGIVTAKVPPQFIDTYNNDRITHATNVLLTFYHNRGFVKASVSRPEVNLGSSDSGGTLQLVVKITENNLYELGQIRLSGTTAFRESVAVSMLNVRPKSPANLSKINGGILALREAYLALGYLDVDIKPSLDAPDGKKTANLQIDVVEGDQYHLGRVELVGGSPVNEKLLREILPFQAGDIFGKRAFDACLETVNELGITPVLTAADVTFSRNKPKALVDVSIYLKGKN